MTPRAVPPKTDTVKLTRLLRRERDVCMGSVAAKLAIDVERVITAVQAVGKTITVEQTLSRCTVCRSFTARRRVYLTQ